MEQKEDFKIQKLSEKLDICMVAEKMSLAHNAIHFCSICDLPSFTVARHMPCQHVCCYRCSEGKPLICPTCNREVNNVFHVSADEIHICPFQNCQRSYLSEFSLGEHQKLRGHELFKIKSSNTS